MRLNLNPLSMISDNFSLVKRTASLLLVGASFSLATMTSVQAGNFYKWTDENGKVHYSQRKPMNQKNIQQLDVRARKVSQARKVAAAQSGAEAKGGKSKKMTAAEKKNKQLEEKLKKQNDAMNKQRCQALQTSMDNLNEGGRIYEMKDGKKSYLSGDQIDQRRKKVRSTYMRDCAK